MRFRRRLAREIGVCLDAMVGFQSRVGNTSYDTSGCPIPWSKVHDPIVPLLNHSDCEGELSPEECRVVAPRLRELVSGWPDEDFDKQNALRLAEGMDSADGSGQPLEFV